MGVTGLWTVLAPCARPTKLETLNKARLAVDASIWIYQFLKAVRDKEGNALRNSHVVGFFRRICKLLFFGIRPVFVFDGGAPVLKRQTISGRKARREGRREDAIKTAGKMLALQMQRRAEEEKLKRRDEGERADRGEEEEPVPENLVYVDELQMTAEEKMRSRTFKKKDAYHLPNLDVDLADMGAPNDPRVMSHEELEEYARQFHTGEDVNLYDFSKIDYESPFFLSLPASDRYNILNAARLRSRLRMGHSKEQLDGMFPNRMDFSRFQIERVKERNELTQRLMNLNGMNGEDAMFGINNPGRVAGEKGKEYVLVKNDGVEGGWALGVVSNKGEGERSKPINVENFGMSDDIDEVDEKEAEDGGFEDVPIEGLNRLPKRAAARRAPADGLPSASEELQKRRQAVYQAQREAAGLGAREDEGEEDPDSLFLQTNPMDTESKDNDDELFEDVLPPADEDDEDLSRAIAMSLQQEGDNVEDTEEPTFAASAKAGPRIDMPLDFNQKNAKVGRDAAHLINNRANRAAPKSFADDSDEEDNIDLQAALQESRMSRHKPHSGPKVHDFKKPDLPGSKANVTKEGPTAQPSGHVTFDGPLPFESLSLGKSILGQKKKPVQEEAGGFEKEAEKDKPPQPLPPWFSGDIRKETAKQRAIEESQFEGGDPDRRGRLEESVEYISTLRRQQIGEVIDLDAPKESNPEPIVVEDDEDEVMQDDCEEEDEVVIETNPIESQSKSDDIPELTRTKSPISEKPNDIFHSDETQLTTEKHTPEPESQHAGSDEEADWSESDHENHRAEQTNGMDVQQQAKSTVQEETPRSPSPEFEDVRMTGTPAQPTQSSPIPLREEVTPPLLPQEESTDNPFLNDIKIEDHDSDYSDPEDADLLRSLAAEADEHARFAATLNNATQIQTASDYDRELRQLRNQQKKDRRDADEVTTIMITECQQLLRLFGLPYITAPMEAEAQCAELVHLGLVDGIVTDDSDIFLFGGTRVYKNFFNQAKFVELYLASDLDKEYALTREKLIRFAHLLGSDYTDGLPSVGPVTALEILSDFDDLDAFADWWNNDVQQIQPATTESQNKAAESSFRRKFRKNKTKLFLPTGFPSPAVSDAYIHPEVDSSPDPFQWGVPDLDQLRAFLMATIGWSQERTDEVLVPVIRDMNRRDVEGVQSNITQFFRGGVGAGAVAAAAGARKEGGVEGFAPRRKDGGKSKRMESALGRLHQRAKGGVEGGVDEDGVAAGGSRKRNGRGRRAADEENGVEDDDGVVGDGDEEGGVVESSKRRKAGSKGGKTQRKRRKG